MEQTFYPSLSSLISLNDLPPQLDFLNAALSGAFNSTFFRDLQFSKSRNGARAFYSLTLIRYESLEFEIPGTGIFITFNRTDENLTAIPVTLSYEWEILNLINGFSFDTFEDTVKGLFALIANHFRVDLKVVVKDALLRYVTTPDDVDGMIDGILDAINNNPILNPSRTIEVSRAGLIEDIIDELIGEIEDALNLPTLEILYVLYVDLTTLSFDEQMKQIEQIFLSAFGGMSVVEYVKKLVTPKIDASLHSDVSIVFPRPTLVPAIGTAENPVPDGDTSHHTTLTIGGADFYFSTTRGIGFETSFEGNLTRSFIGDTGFVVEFKKVKLDLSTTTNIPEATADGRGPEFVGAFIEYAELNLPAFWKRNADNLQPEQRARIVGRNILIGTGGLSGEFSLETTPQQSLIETTFGVSNPPAEAGDEGFAIALSKFTIRFHQGAITGTEILGKLTIGGKIGRGEGDEQKEVDVEITIDKHGFKIGGTFKNIHLGIKNIFDYEIKTLGLGKLDDRYFIETSGILDVTARIPGTDQRFIEKKMDIGKLVIWSNGEFDFQGGSLVLPSFSPLKIGPVELSVSALHWGREVQHYGEFDRSYRFIGFDGGIKSGVGGVDARGEGIKLYFTVDDTPTKPAHWYLRIETIRVDLRIPGEAPPEEAALILQGYVSMKNASAPTIGGEANRALTEYAGGVTFTLPQLKMGGGADLRLIPSIGAFLVDAHLELATPILLGSTGLGIYGFRGMFGNKFVLEKPEDKTWWEFYKTDTMGIHSDKFTQAPGVSIGAGVSLATAVDSGTTFSSKLFFLLSIPSVFLLEGQASILSKRIGLDTTDDAPFHAFIAISPASVETAFNADLKIPEDSGFVLTLDATLEMAFFFGNSSGWYLNVGRDEPIEKRVQATLLKILKGWSYFMLSSQGIKAGAGVEWKFGVDCGIASVSLGASLEVHGHLSFHPIQFGGRIALQGYAELRVFGIGFRLSIKATLAGEAPKPFIISGSFDLSLSTPWPLPDIDISVSLTWRFDSDPNLSEAGLMAPPQLLGLGPDPCVYEQEPASPVKATHMLTGQAFPLNVVRRTYVLRDDPEQGNVSRPSIPDPNVVGTGDNQWLGQFSGFTIPIDSFIDIEFLKGVLPNTTNPSMSLLAPLQTGTENVEYIPPQRGHSPQVKHTYTVENIYLQYWTSQSGWDDIDILAASTPVLDVIAQSDPTAYAANRLQAIQDAYQEMLDNKVRYGFWQITEANTFNKLRLLARSPFTQNPTVPVTELGFPPTAFLCPPEDLTMECATWLGVTVGHQYPGVETDDRTFATVENLRFRVIDEAGVVVTTANVHNIARSLQIGPGNQIEFVFPVAVTRVEIKLTTLAQKVLVSYYLGYPYVAVPQRTTPDGRPIDTWKTSLSAGKPGQAEDDMWDRLRAIPSFVRAFCSGSPVLTDASVIALDAVMVKKFRKTNAYLRQLWGLHAADPSGTYCARLREMLELLIVGLAGGQQIPRALRKNADLFYHDAQRYAVRYIESRLSAGGTIPEPPADQNLFYERWLDMLTCIGKAYDRRATLPANIQTMLSGQFNEEIAQLYYFAQTTATNRDIRLNYPPDITDPLARLKFVTEFFAILSLTLDTTNIPAALITALEPYYTRLDRLTGSLRAALSVRRNALCATATGSIVPAGDGAVSAIGAGKSCDRLTELHAIVRLFCSSDSGPYTNAKTGPIITAIESLLSDFTPALASLESYFGWGTSGAGANFCERLRRVLRAVAVAYSVYDQLASDLRVKVKAFFDRLAKLAADYGEATDQERPDPSGAVDTFLDNWIAALGCLCRLCAEVESFGDQGERDYFTTTVDPEIDDLYDDVVAITSAAGESVFGSSLPADDCDLISMAIGFLAAITTQCPVDSALQTWLGTIDTAFAASYDNAGAGTGFRQGSIANYVGVLCDAAATNSTCNAWIDALECLDALIERRGYLPASIIDQITDDFDGLLLDISNQVFFVYQDILQWPFFHTTIENTQFEVRYILGHIYNDCLQGNAVNPAVLARLLDGQLTTLATNFDSLKTALAALPADQQILLCESPRKRHAQRLRSVVENYRRLCNTPPANFGVSPISTIITLLRSNQSLIDDIAAELGLQSVAAGWPDADFCPVISTVTRLLALAYGRTATISLQLESRMNAFMDALQPSVDAYAAGSTSPSGACQTACDDVLTKLYCLETICEFKRYLPAAVFTGTGNKSIADKLHAHLVDIAKHAILWSDNLGLEGIAGRGIASRCAKVRVIANYFAMQTLSYADAAAVQSFFDGHASLITALNNGLGGMRGSFCPEPGSGGAYDPLRKQEKIASDALGSAVVYNEPDKPIDRIVIRPFGDCQAPSCETLIQQVCWLSQEDNEYNTNLPDETVVVDTNKSVVFALTKMVQPVWRPNTFYAIQIETAERIGDSSSTTYRNFYTFGFRTEGPVGHFHAIDDGSDANLNCIYKKLRNADREAEYQYANLKQYIDYARSYPNADGNIIGAKPLYYHNSRLFMFYRRDYIVAMYGQWAAYKNLPEVRSGLQLVIRDSSLALPSSDISIDPVWWQDDAPPETPDQRIFKYMVLNAGPCLQFDPVDVTAKPPARKSAVPLGTSLKPRKLYTAVFNAVHQVMAAGEQEWSREVHKFVFQTSRYPDFQTHIQSYLLDGVGGTRKAVYIVPVNPDDVEVAQGLLSGARPTSAPAIGERYDAVNAQFALEFDRVVEGGFKLGAMPQPETVEFNLIVAEGGNVAIGILVRSPEPFNDPKLPLDQLLAGLTVTGLGDSPTVIFSKDASRVFVTNSAASISGGTSVTFTFAYRLFDGADYTLATTVEEVPAPGGGTMWQQQDVTPVSATITIP